MGTKPALAKFMRKMTASASKKAVAQMHLQWHSQQTEDRSIQDGHLCITIFLFSLWRHGDIRSGQFLSLWCCKSRSGQMNKLSEVYLSGRSTWRRILWRIEVCRKEGLGVGGFQSSPMKKMEAEKASGGRPSFRTSHFTWFSVGHWWWEPLAGWLLSLSTLDESSKAASRLPAQRLHPCS